MSRRVAAGRIVVLAAAGASALALTGCMGVNPGANAEAARKQVTQIHVTTLTVTAPTGSVIEYGWGKDRQAARVDSTGQWTRIVDVPGITSVSLSVTPNSLVGADATASCGIKIAGKTLDQSSTIPGMGGSIECRASTAAT